MGTGLGRGSELDLKALTETLTIIKMTERPDSSTSLWFQLEKIHTKCPAVQKHQRNALNKMLFSVRNNYLVAKHGCYQNTPRKRTFVCVQKK